MAKPKIYGHCPAGCEWEVPHKSDFDAYMKVASRFPEPTLNNAKKLTEGSGYYYLKTSFRSHGVFYWKEGSDISLPADVYMVGTQCQMISISVSSDGTLKSYYGVLKKDEEWTLREDITDTTSFYTAKIVDTELPDIAEGESY